MKFEIPEYLLNDGSAQSADEVKKHELPGSPQPFQNSTEHKDGKHIEKKMRKRGVHKHIGDHLRRIELLSRKIVHAHDVVQIEVDAASLKDSGK